jgi:hypothetical protein
MPQYTKEQITPQWLAGFFDGEGCVASNELRPGLWNLSVSFTQKDLSLIKLISDMFPGGFVSIRQNGTSRVQWSGRMAIPILEFLIPNLVIKKEHAILGVELGKLTPSWRKKSSMKSSRFSRAEVGRKIKQLNDLRKGISLASMGVN